jgi:hypothetical protein
MTVAEARTAGWDDERIITEFHRANWPTIAGEAVEQLDTPYAGSRLRMLTETEEGADIAAYVMTEVFVEQGYDRETVARAIERAMGPDRDDPGQPPLRRTWPVGLKALVVVGTTSFVLAWLLWRYARVPVLVPVLAWWGGVLAVVLGLVVRRGHGSARWIAVALCALAGIGLPLVAGAVAANGVAAGPVVAWALGLAYLVAGYLVTRASERPVHLSLADPVGRLLYLVAWAVLLIVFARMLGGITGLSRGLAF